MCNNLHKNSKRNWERKFGDNKDYGIGYKVFCKHRKNKNILYPAVKKGYYKIGEWIKWDQTLAVDSDGFCFFLTLKNAKKYTRFDGDTIRKIRYRKGIGYHLEPCLDYIRVAICKEFKILEEVKE